MKEKINKTKISTIALILILTFSAIYVALPIVSAHEPAWEVPTWTYINVAPNPVGVGQQIIIIVWCNTPHPTAGGANGDRWTFYVDVTTPSGQTTLGPITSDPVGSGYTLYTPTQVGTYTFVARMDAHTLTGLPNNPNLAVPDGAAYINDTYLASTSDPATATVQEDPIESWPETPLPTEYWTRPIDSANRDWWKVTGNWLGGAAQTASAAVPAAGQSTRFGYGPAPASAHILWTKPYWTGGIMDYRTGDTGFQTGHYTGLTFSPIIIDGKIYYDARNTAQTTQGYYVVDLYTGETLYYENSTMPSFGQIYDYESPNQHGGFPYIWRTSGVTLPDGYTSMSGTQTWQMIDAYTGNPITIIANVSAGGTAVYGKDGSILRYSIVKTAGVQYLRCWNSSAIPSMLPGTTGTELWQWRPADQPVHDGDTAWSLNVTVSPQVQGSILAVSEGKYIIGGTSGTNKNGEPLVLGNMWALSLKPGEEGTLLWNYTYTPPYDVAPAEAYGSMYRGVVFGPSLAPEDGVFYFVDSLTREIWGFDLATGDMLWGPTNPEPDFQYYGLYNYVYEGKLLTFGYSGILTAYNITTGDVLWTYTAKGIGYESPYGNYPVYSVFVADGKVYLVSGEHSPTQPLWRGPNLRCIDATTGDELWKILFWGAGAGGGHLTATMAAIADGTIIGLNYYDAQIYAFGKGPSKTTGPDTAIELGTPILIKGTVTDQSAGTKQLEQASRFPNGVPAASDASQENWMEYVYMQQPCPADAQGVPVTLYSIDPNGNYQDIGEVTSDLWGSFGKSWVPPVPGDYLIVAEFKGSDSYWASSASTYVTVTEAPSVAQAMEPELAAPAPTAPTQTEPTTPTAEAPFITTEIAIIAAVAVACIIGAVAFLALRKRK